MRVLFLANRFPYPPYRGDKLKIYNLAKRLSKKHELLLLTFIQDKKDYEHLPELEKIFSKVTLVDLPYHRSAANCLSGLFSGDPLQVCYFRSGRMKEQLNEILSKESIDIIHTQHLRMSQYTCDLGNVKRILDLPDAYSLYWKRRIEKGGSPLRQAFARSEYRKVLRYEGVIRKFDMTLVCSEEDREHLNKVHGADNIGILHNGVDTDTFSSDGHDYGNNSSIVFSGNMGYYPNIDAAKYFAREVFPEVKKRFPDVILRIAGQNPVKEIEALRSESIVVTGFVKSLKDEYAQSSVAVSPVRVGAGTMNKVLEPMAMGVPVVMSEVGFRGLGAIPGKDLMLARNTGEFTDAISKLLSDAELRKKIGESGKDLVTGRYSWDRISETLDGYFQELSMKN